MKLNFLKSRSWRRWTALVAVLLMLVLALGLSMGDAEASGHLWNAWYWNNTDLSGEPVLYVVEPIGFDLGAASPHSGVSADDFSARFIKTISVDSAGNYTFAARVDDGVRVWVDGDLIIDDWMPAAAHEVSATTSLTAGAHEVQVEYFDTRDNALLVFDWGPAGTVEVGEAPAAEPAAPTDAADAAVMGDGPLATVGQEFRLNVRRGPSVNYPVIATIDGGTTVEMLYRWEAGFWVAVRLPDGQIGWVNATYLNADFATGELAEWTQDPQAVVAQTARAGEPGAAFVGDGPRATVGPEFRLNVRRGPNVSYPVISTIDGGTEVEMLYRWEEGMWIAVQLPDGRIGWVNATYLNADFATGDLPAWTRDPEMALTGAAPVQAAAPAGDEGADFMGIGPLAFVGTGQRLNVRTGPSVDYPIIESIPGGQEVEMLYRWEEGTWIAVELPNGHVGWVNATHLHSDFATGELPAYTGDPEAIAAEAAGGIGAPGDVFADGPRAFVGQDFRLNLREGPDVTYPVIRTLPGGQEVEMIYRWEAGRWVAVRLPDGEIGWVNATYLDADFATGDLPEWVEDPTLVLAD